MTKAEIVGVTAVGLGLAWAAKKAPQIADHPVLTGAALYVLGYWVAATWRPEGGYALGTGR